MAARIQFGKGAKAGGTNSVLSRFSSAPNNSDVKRQTFQRKKEDNVKKFLIGFIAGISAATALVAAAACFEDGELITNVNIMLMDTGDLIHCPTISYAMDGHHINCNR